MMLCPINIEKIYLRNIKDDFFREVSIFERILNDKEGKHFCCETKKWMQTLIEKDLDVTCISISSSNFVHCKSYYGTEMLEQEDYAHLINIGLYCCPKSSEYRLELLKERSLVLKDLHDVKGSMYVTEKLFYDFNFYTPSVMIQHYSHEAMDALHALDLRTTRLYLTKFIDFMEKYGSEIHEQRLEEYRHQINYLKNEIELKQNEPPQTNFVISPKMSEKFIAKTDIDPSDILLVDSPRVCVLEKKGFQCDNCHNIANLLPCFDCHCVFYCSSECEKEDSVFHKYECLGLRSKILYLIRGQIDVRNLIVTMKNLKSTFLDVINVQKTQEPKDLWRNLIWMHINNINTPHYNFFHHKNNVDEILQKELQFLCTKTVQILIYLKSYTSFFNDFFGHITNIARSDIEIFICALIFKHAIIQRTKLMHFKIEVVNPNPSLFVHPNETKTEETSKDDENEIFVSKSMKIIKKLCDDCFQLCGSQYFPDIESHQLTNKQIKPFVKKLNSLYLQEGNKMTMEGSSTPSKMFLEESSHANPYLKLLNTIVATQKTNNNTDLEAIFDEFAQKVKTIKKFLTLPKTINYRFEQKMSCLYENLTNIEHSCCPNTILIPGNCGSVQLKAVKKIVKGEKLTMSYGPNYLCHCRQDRKAKCDELFFECECSACTADYDYYERINNEECKNCYVPIYETDGKCLKCNKKTFINVPKDLLIRILNKYQSDLDFSDFDRKLHAYLTIYTLLTKFLPRDSPILQKQMLNIANMMIRTEEPMVALDVIEKAETLSCKIYPPMSMQLCDQLHFLFKMYHQILQFNFQSSTRKFKTKELEMIQNGLKLSEKIKIIENAWGIYDLVYEEYEYTNLSYSKLIDKYYQKMQDADDDDDTEDNESVEEFKK
uniref:CSON001192 protein n=1 Tax=Culicoides sonorensis TaxID=179676 RepID=A0A336MIS4_CULSO